MHSAIILAARGGLAAVQVPSCHLTLQPAAMPWRWPPSTPHPGGRRWTGWGRSGAGQLSGQPWAPPAPPGQPNPAPTLPGWSWTWAPAGMSQVSWWMGLVVVPMPPGSLLSWVVCHLSKLPKEAADPPPPTCDSQESLGAPLATPCSGCTGANWDPDSIGPSWLFPVLIFFLPHCSHFWDEQVNIMLLHLVPASAFCSAKPAANGGFVQRPAGRKWGHCETGGRRREECSRGLSAPWGRVGDVGAQEGALRGLG